MLCGWGVPVSVFCVVDCGLRRSTEYYFVVTCGYSRNQNPLCLFCASEFLFENLWIADDDVKAKNNYGTGTLYQVLYYLERERETFTIYPSATGFRFVSFRFVSRS